LQEFIQHKAGTTQMELDPLDIEKIVPDAKLGIGRKFTPIKIAMLVAVLAVGGGALYLSLAKKSEPQNPFGASNIPTDYSPSSPVGTQPGADLAATLGVQEPQVQMAPEPVAPQATYAVTQEHQYQPVQPVAQTAPEQLPAAPAPQAQALIPSAPVAAAPAPVAQPIPQPVAHVHQVAPVQKAETTKAQAKPKQPKRVQKPAQKTEPAEIAVRPVHEGELVTSEEILIIQ
jgi:outer membrane biosynthesis protein TonB